MQIIILKSVIFIKFCTQSNVSSVVIVLVNVSTVFMWKCLC